MLHLPTLILVAVFVACTSALDYVGVQGADSDFSLHRIARAHPGDAALLVPFPRVGKRSPLPLPEPDMMETEGDGPAEDAIDEALKQKRLFVARVGKRFMYAARVGK